MFSFYLISRDVNPDYKKGKAWIVLIGIQEVIFFYFPAENSF